MSLYSSGTVTTEQLLQLFGSLDREFISEPELQEYVEEKLGELDALDPEDREKLDRLPLLEESAGPNGVKAADGKLEVESLTPDRLETEGYVFVLDGGDAARES